MFKTAHELDPSRPMMGDGAGDLLGQCEICNWHYCEVGPIVDPNDVLTMAERGQRGRGRRLSRQRLHLRAAAAASARSGRGTASGRYGSARPISTAGPSSGNAGSAATRPWPAALRPTRPAHVSSICCAAATAGRTWRASISSPARDSLPGPEASRTRSPRLPSSRATTTATTSPPSSFHRRLKIFNDTLDEGPIDLDWELLLDGKPAGSRATRSTRSTRGERGG